MKRVYLRYGNIGNTIPGAGALTQVKEIFRAEEDMTLIGVQMAAKVHIPGNDGICDIRVALTSNADDPVSLPSGTGHICQIRCLATWNTTPAFGNAGVEHIVLMFPPGHGVTLPEEAVLNLTIRGSNTTAANVSALAEAFLYLVKGVRG